jgi:hypothetical protein
MTTAAVIRKIQKYELILQHVKKEYAANVSPALDAAFETKIHILEQAIKNLKCRLPEGS